MGVVDYVAPVLCANGPGVPTPVPPSNLSLTLVASPSAAQELLNTNVILTAQASQPVPSGYSIYILDLASRQVLAQCASSPCFMSVTSASPVVRNFIAIVATGPTAVALATSSPGSLAWVEPGPVTATPSATVAPLQQPTSTPLPPSAPSATSTSTVQGAPSATSTPITIVSPTPSSAHYLPSHDGFSFSNWHPTVTSSIAHTAQMLEQEFRLPLTPDVPAQYQPILTVFQHINGNCFGFAAGSGAYYEHLPPPDNAGPFVIAPSSVPLATQTANASLYNAVGYYEGTVMNADIQDIFRTDQRIQHQRDNAVQPDH